MRASSWANKRADRRHVANLSFSGGHLHLRYAYARCYYARSMGRLRRVGETQASEP